MTADEDFQRLKDLAKAVSRGFERLQVELMSQRQLSKALHGKLRHAADQVDKIVSMDAFDLRHDAWVETRGDILKPATPVDVHPESAEQETSGLNVPEILEALEACRTIRTWTAPAKDTLRTCPVTHQTTDRADFEHDFTTPGAQGNLKCPFSETANLPNTPDSIVDPIATEFHQDRASVSSTHAEPQSKCPIRFLDQHSPEEVAQYFENHKHEIPRSHEICVKRYQQNETSIRQLDAKYGNLVNMIQGLGVKHKQYLPENEKGDAFTERDPSSTRAVQQWAEDISHRSEVTVDPISPDDTGADERIPRFEKPLREIRVGESPSRPWGIFVPLNESPAEHLSEEEPLEAAQVPSLQNLPESPDPDVAISAEAARPSCPYGHGVKKVEAVMEQPTPHHDQAGIESDGTSGLNPKGSYRAKRHNFIFNGPVFFGCSPEQATTLLQSFASSKV